MREAGPAESLLDQVEPSVPSAAVLLSSGRRYDLAAGNDADRLMVRSRGGEVILRIEITDAGPVLSFSGASIDVSATGRLRLSGREVAIQSDGDASLSIAGSLHERVGGHHHTLVVGDERLEATMIEAQANEGDVHLRAAGRVALDGEQVGLNDDPEPRPFAWSQIAPGRAQDCSVIAHDPLRPPSEDG